MKYFEKSSESNKKDYTTTGVVGGSTAAVLAAGQYRASTGKKNYFKTFDELQDHYKDMQKGDMLFFKDTGANTNLHPLIIEDNKNYYDWPTEEGAKKGLKEKLVTDFSKIDPDRPNRYKGKFIEFGPEKNPIQVGPLEKRLKDTSHLNGEFLPGSTSRYGDVFTHKNFNEEYFDKRLQYFKDNINNPKIKYEALGRGFSGEGCGSGNCVTFTDNLLNSKSKKPVILPGVLEKDLLLKFKGRDIPTNKFNMISTILGVDGIRRIYKGVKGDNESDVLTGGAELGAGTLIQTNKKLRGYTGIPTSFYSDVIGTMPKHLLRNTIRKIKGEPVSSLANSTEHFVRSSPKSTRFLGGAILALPLSYGIPKGITYMQNKLERN